VITTAKGKGNFGRRNWKGKDLKVCLRAVTERQIADKVGTDWKRKLLEEENSIPKTQMPRENKVLPTQLQFL
jgi:hypothetical protein